MVYEIELLEKAVNALNALPDFLQGPVQAHLIDLAISPSAMSRPVVSPPYPPGGMISEFDVGPFGKNLHHISVFYRYSRDETTLEVFAIGHSALRNPD
jgi:hypothetical protein